MIKTKNSINIIHIESNGQQSFFGRDNIFFKTINMPKKQRFQNICCNFKLKKHIKKENYFYLFFQFVINKI